MWDGEQERSLLHCGEGRQRRDYVLVVSADERTDLSAGLS